jgi:aminobenzoyl-glutamate utilization protein B
MPKTTAAQWLQAHATELRYLCDQVWDYSEVSLQEHQSSELLAGYLEKQGFAIERGVAGMPTAFIATYGKGQPVVGLLGEYDALPGLSQAKDPRRAALTDGGPGHGCGHNLLGTGAVAAAVAVKQAIAAGEVAGQVRFYGCPAEETLVGKVFMARAGLFDDLDAAITWHPMAVNSVWESNTLAMNSVQFTFHGVTAHAAANPDLGRSALDAVELMNIGVNFLREHMPPDARIHYVITNGGGEPNVVPATATVWYYVRAPRRADVDDLYERVVNCAKGAALMTGTTFTSDFLTACHDFQPNIALGEAAVANLKSVGAPAFTAEDEAFARQLNESFPAGQKAAQVRGLGIAGLKAEDLYHTDIADTWGRGRVGHGSTEVGDVSYITPTAQVVTACYPIGVAGHSWQLTAAVGLDVGFKGMLAAAGAMALTAVDVLKDAELRARMRTEFATATGGARYRTPLPEGAEPPFRQLKH